jgi:tetratricopeptide (TPR) repeat protein
VDKMDVLVLIYMGILLLKRKNYYAAEKYIQDALKIDKQNDDAWFYLGESYLKAGEYRKALNMFETVRNLNPSHSDLGQRIKEIKERPAMKYTAEKPPSLIQRILNKLTGQ